MKKSPKLCKRAVECIDVITQCFVLRPDAYTDNAFILMAFGKRAGRQAIEYMIDEGFLVHLSDPSQKLIMYGPGNLSAHALLRWEAKKESLKK